MSGKISSLKNAGKMDKERHIYLFSVIVYRVVFKCESFLWVSQQSTDFSKENSISKIYFYDSYTKIIQIVQLRM